MFCEVINQLKRIRITNNLKSFGFLFVFAFGAYKEQILVVGLSGHAGKRIYIYLYVCNCFLCICWCLCLCFHTLIFEGSGGRSSVGTLVGACQLRNSFGLFLHARHHLFCADLHISLNFVFVFVFFVILYLCLEATEFISTPLGRMLSSRSTKHKACRDKKII